MYSERNPERTGKSGEEDGDLQPPRGDLYAEGLTATWFLQTVTESYTTIWVFFT